MTVKLFPTVTPTTPAYEAMIERGEESARQLKNEDAMSEKLEPFDSIWLQFYGIDSEPDEWEKPEDVDGISWHFEPVFNSDIEYRRVGECVCANHVAAQFALWMQAKYCPQCGNRIKVES